MADAFFYGDLTDAEAGAGGAGAVPAGADSAGKPVSVRVTYTATGATKLAVLGVLAKIAARIAAGKWPPV